MRGMGCGGRCAWQADKLGEVSEHQEHMPSSPFPAPRAQEDLTSPLSPYPMQERHPAGVGVHRRVREEVKGGRAPEGEIRSTRDGDAG
eukprot:238402-Chlamydomonas_euryale.AAC.2